MTLKYKVCFFQSAHRLWGSYSLQLKTVFAINKGFLQGPFSVLPFDIFRISPIGVVESKYSKKKRLIVDLSTPHDLGDICSLNDLINKEDFSLSYAIRINKQLRQETPIFLCKTDVSDAFKQIPLHPTLWPYHGIKWHDQYYFYTRLVFGCRSSPMIFDTFASMVCWILENNYGIKPGDSCIYWMIS